MLHRSMKASAVALMFLLAGCGSGLTECVFSDVVTERLQSGRGVNFNLILVGNGHTNGWLFDDSEDGMALAPDLRLSKNFTNTGGPYIQQAYTLDPGVYRVNIQSAGGSASRELRFQNGTSVMIQAECP